MTTICFRNGSMAADTGTSTGNYSLPYARKIARGNDGTLYGCTGNSAECQTFLDWVEAGCTGHQPAPRQLDDGCSSFNVIVARPSGSLEVITAYGTERMFHANYMAIGAGTECALGALYMGATAEEAVAAVIAHNAGAFGGIDTVRHF